MPTISETKESLKDFVLESYRDEYGDCAENWRNLETKAQGNIAVAGIFIAGVFAFLTKTGSALNEYERFFLIIAIGFLLSSIISSILVLQTRNVPAPSLVSFVDYSVKRLLLVENTDFHERLRRFNNDHFKKWREVINRTDKARRLKADRLWIAQGAAYDGYSFSGTLNAHQSSELKKEKCYIYDGCIKNTLEDSNFCETHDWASTTSRTHDQGGVCDPPPAYSPSDGAYGEPSDGGGSDKA